MAAGALIAPNSNHHTVRRQQATRGPGNIDGLPRGKKWSRRSKRMALKARAR